MAQSVGEIALDIVVGQNNVGNAVRGAVNDVENTVNGGTGRISGALGKIGGVATKVGAVATAAVGVAATGIGAIGKQAVEEYANYEQLVGGVETLFKDSKDTVMQYANDAYKTAGMSANAYMETVTSFSASLLQSVGGDTKKAADDANLAITDMSDNANKMGTDITMIQNAYNGFAKQNYTMLDNLKLGYGGTKEEMQRLLEDAEKISGIHYDLSSFDDIVQAIHVMQQEMGIAGTTAKEASTTIEGSINSMKGAWTNFITGMADENQDIGKLADNLVSSVSDVMDNLIPRIGQALNGIATGLNQIIPKISAQLPQWISTLLPPLISGAVQLVGGLVAALPQIVQGLIDAMPSIVASITQGFGDSLGSSLNAVIGIAVGAGGPLLLMVGKICSVLSTLGGSFGTIISVGSTVVGFITSTLMPALSGFFAFLLANPIVLVITAIIAVIALLVANWDTVKQAAISAWNGIVDCVSGAVDALVGFFTETLPSAFSALGDKFSEIGGGIKDFFGGLWTSIKDTASSKWESIKSTVVGAATSVKDGITTKLTQAKEGASSAWNSLKSTTSSVWGNIKETVSNKAGEAKTGAVNAFNTLKSGVSTAMSNAKTDVHNRWTLIGNATTTIVGRIKESGVSGFKNLVSGIGSALGNVTSTVQSGFNGAISFITSLPGKAIEWGKDFIQGLVNGIKSMIGKVKDAVSDVASTIKSYIHFSVPDVGPLTDYETYMPDFMTGLATGIKSSKGVVIAEMQSLTGDMATTASALINNASLSGGKMQNLLDNMNAKKNLSASSSSRGGLGKTTSYSDYSSNSKSKSSNEESDGGDWIFPIYIGSDAIDEYILTRQNRKTIRSGGRA